MFKEAMIGNFVEYDSRIFQIQTIAEEFPTLNTDEFGVGVVTWDNIKPIALTEEWVLRFGFRLVSRINSTYSYFLNAKCFFDIVGCNDNWVNPYSQFGELKYVHELQNSFFWETRKELKYV